MCKKIFITGATGFIGQKLARRLADEGNQVVALIRTKAKSKDLEHENISFVEGDLFNLTALEIGMHKAHQVYHLANRPCSSFTLFLHCIIVSLLS